MGVFLGERVLVVGLGTSGVAAAKVMSEEGASVRVSEERQARGTDVDALRSAGVEVLAGGHRPEHLDGISLVVASPGVPERAPILAWALERHLPIWSELEVGARLCRTPYLAITGTNGKSTTTGMIAEMLRAAGMDAAVCGNIGHPFTLAAREDHDVLCVEASSFQLRFHETFRPKVSVLLNVAPDHIDWHGSFEAYAEAKGRIFELQAQGDTHVGNLDDAFAASVSRRAPCARAWFTLGQPVEDGQVGYAGERMSLRLGGSNGSIEAPDGPAGYRADAAAAAAAALSFGAGVTAVEDGLRSFPPLKHRGEVVARTAAVSFVDDSKATNPHAALASLAGRERCVLIAGGLAKGVDLSPLAEAAERLAAVVAIGQAAPEVAAVFEGRVPVRNAESIEEAARFAYELAPERGTVILAPACASQDMFRDYEERGERFAAEAARIVEEAGRG